MPSRCSTQSSATRTGPWCFSSLSSTSRTSTLVLATSSSFPPASTRSSAARPPTESFIFLNTWTSALFACCEEEMVKLEKEAAILASQMPVLMSRTGKLLSLCT